MIDEARNAIQAYLQQRGFAPTQPHHNTATYAARGELDCRGQRVPIQIEFLDWTFISYPKIYLLERPTVLAGYRPHLGAGQELCYLMAGEVPLDAYAPVAMVHSCLEQAQRVLHAVSGDASRIDREDEFRTHWRSGEGFALIGDVVDPKTAGLEFWGLSTLSCPKRDRTLLVVAKDPRRLTDDLQSIGYRSPMHHLDSCLVIRLQSRPCFDPNDWPPHSLNHLLRWLKRLDDSAYRGFIKGLESNWMLKSTLGAVLFSSPSGHFGLTFTYDIPTHFDKKYFEKRPAAFRQHVIRHAHSITISRFDSIDITPAFIHGRNQGGAETFAGRTIHLVGCGTIGGYLATYLTRLGAGTGGGKLNLIDHDVLMPSNLGRHVLTMKDLFENKAQALASHLRGEFPYIAVEAWPADVRTIGRLFDCDVVIDATGEEPVSRYINHRHIARRADSKCPPVLYSWIEGPGLAARTLLVDGPEHMCFECQFVRTAAGRRQDRYPLLLDDTDGADRPIGADCETYTQFPVSASVSAAALALDAISAWHKGRPAPYFRTRRLTQEGTQNRADASPPPLQTCLECQK